LVDWRQRFHIQLIVLTASQLEVVSVDPSPVGILRVSRLRQRLGDPAGYPLVMGILNVTPDSFSDGGRFCDLPGAIKQAREMVMAGADLIDVGGESTRPGAMPVAESEQIARVVPVISAITQELDAAVSIDTTRAAVAEAALEAGAVMVNDISAGRDDPRMFPLVASRRAPIILMHMQGTPATMQDDPRYGDVVGEVSKFLLERADYAQTAGIDPADVLLDPGIGFGKTTEHNLELLNRLWDLVALGRPVVVGTSRKGFIGQITGETMTSGRVFGTSATVAWSAGNGAAVVRVHDVPAMVRVVSMIRVIRNAGRSK
jgi:dihydropteroate synthase